jgi:UDP-N-acetylmuramate dehydrogenase
MGVEELNAALGDRALVDEPLSKHTTFQIGGPADLFVVAQTLGELREVVGLAWKHRVPYLILGRGANLLVADKGLRGLVIHNQCGAFAFSEGEDRGAWWVTSESGADLRAVAHQAVDRGLAGLEWAVDVPGTVGGAVVGNAGAYGGYVADNLHGVAVLWPEGGESWWPTSELGLEYRSSILKQKEKKAGFSPVILSATFALRSEDPALVRERAVNYSQRRAEAQPEGPSAGSTFKRTDQYPAAFLIENAGLKGKRIGGAIVSPKHANFILNEGSATAQDVMELIDLIRETVLEKFQAALELEIELVGEW